MLQRSVGHRRDRRRPSVQRDVLTPSDAHADLQAVEPIEPAYALTIHAQPSRRNSMCLSSVRSATQTLQPPVFVLELPKAPEFAHPQVGGLLLPRVERRFAGPRLAADVHDPRAR